MVYEIFWDVGQVHPVFLIKGFVHPQRVNISNFTQVKGEKNDFRKIVLSLKWILKISFQILISEMELGRKY